MSTFFNRWFLLSIFVAGISNFLYPQQYQAVNSGTTKFFEFDYYGRITSLRIDSVKSIAGDSVLYPLTTMQQIDDYCYRPDFSSWLGQNIIIRNNGENIFVNRLSDSIVIDTRAKQGDSWLCYHGKDSVLVMASVTSHDTMRFLGLTDSVKWIDFKTYDTGMNPLSLPLDSMTIAISKNYGLIQTINFYLFPQEPLFSSFYGLEEYYLAGLTNPAIGTQNLTWFEVYDFQPGDELYIKYSELSFGPSTTYYKHIVKTIQKYIDRTDKQDSIIYRFERLQYRFRIYDIDTTETFVHDTVESVITINPEFDLLPYSVIISWSVAHWYFMYPGIKAHISSYDHFGEQSDTCYRNIIADGCFSEDYYYNGLGGPYYECSHVFSVGGAKRSLVYYKKGSTTWGSPFVIGLEEKTPDDKKVEVFPIPSNGILNVRLRGSVTNAHLKLFDMNAKAILSEQLSRHVQAIDISRLAPGIYFYSVVYNGNELKSGKLVIQ